MLLLDFGFCQCRDLIIVVVVGGKQPSNTKQSFIRSTHISNTFLLWLRLSRYTNKN